MSANPPKTTAWRNRGTNGHPCTIHVRVYDKSTGRRVVNARAVMLALAGETIKMVNNRYPLYIYEVRRD